MTINGMKVICDDCDYETDVESGVPNHCGKCGKELMCITDKGNGTFVLENYPKEE